MASRPEMSRAQDCIKSLLTIPSKARRSKTFQISCPKIRRPAPFPE
jgi:hypothetical protein